MSEIILQTFISKLRYVSKKVKQPYVIDYEIKVNNYDENPEQITGTITIKYRSGKEEIIPFEIEKKETEDILIFNSKFLYGGKVEETKDIYAISNEQSNSIGIKTRIIVHIVDNKIIEAYGVGRNHKFENGIHDNLPKLNLKNQEVSNVLYRAYPTYSQKRR